MYYIGIDIGGTKVKLGLFDASGKKLHMWEIQTDLSEEGKNIISDISKTIKTTLTNIKISYDDIVGCGVGVPGAVRKDGSVNRCVNLGWGDIPIQKMFEEALSKPIRVINDANVAALGELWMGAGKGLSNIVMITLGTGVGGGVVIDGRIVAGDKSGGGEIGHMNVAPDNGRPCTCGKNGCFEQYASASGIVRSMKEYLKATGEKSCISESLDFRDKDVFEAAKAKDAPARAVVKDTCRIIGKCLADTACVIDPEAFIIGGGISRAGDILIEYTTKYYRKYAFHTSVDTPILLARLGNEAGIYGAAYSVLEK